MYGETKNLLISAMEESAEVIQACSKAIRFGLDGHHPNKRITNADEILIEFSQLQAIVEKLQSEGSLPRYSEDHIRSIKKNKLARVKPENYRKNNRR